MQFGRLLFVKQLLSKSKKKKNKKIMKLHRRTYKEGKIIIIIKMEKEKKKCKRKQKQARKKLNLNERVKRRITTP